MRSLFCLLPLLPLLSSSASSDSRPNVLFIMSDDHTTQALGCYGSRLAGLNPDADDRPAGARGSAVRERILHELDLHAEPGLHPDRPIPTHQRCLRPGGRIETERQYLALEMGKAGYQTAMVGKWHLKAEPGAFDYYCVLPGQGNYFDPVFRVQGEEPWPNNTIQFNGMHSSDAITDVTLKWLKENRDPDKPFFLMHHYKAPHDFFEYAPRYEDYLADVDIPEPLNLWTQPEFGSIATRGANDELVPYIGTSIADAIRRVITPSTTRSTSY